MGSDVGQIFPTASLHRDHSISYALVCEKNKIHHWCSVGTEKSQPEGPPSSGKRGLPSFPLNGGPEGWDFFGTTEHQWSILFLIYHDRTVQYIHIITLVTWSDGSDHVEWVRQERPDHTRRSRVWSGRSWRTHETWSDPSDQVTKVIMYLLYTYKNNNNKARTIQ